jgi:hypothetical protein
MKRACLIFLFLCCTATFMMSQPNPVASTNQSASVVSPMVASQADSKAQARILDQYGKLPLSFEANYGQTDGRVKFLSRTNGYSLFLTADEAVLALNGQKASTNTNKENGNKGKIANAPSPLRSGTAVTKSGGVLRMKLRNANAAAKVTGEDELAGTSNYFIGNDPAKWRTSAPTFAKVKYEGIYSGIDLVYYGNQRQLEYDFIVAPGADLRRIAFDVSGAKRIRQDAQGELVFKVGEDEIRWHKPVVYQEKDGTRREIAARYAITDANRVGFELAKYDVSRPLYIDPLIYSTYLGGSGDENFNRGGDIAVDGVGNAYVTGVTYSANFPTTPGAFQEVCNGGSGCGTYGDAFVAKINPSGSALVYSTFLGGSDEDYGLGVTVDSDGNAYITGGTRSTDFPVTPGAFETTFNNGNDCAYCSNGFVTKLNPTGSALVFSTFLGGSGGEEGRGVVVGSSGVVYVAGRYAGTGFPVTPGAFQTACNGDSCGFVTKFNPRGSALVYSTLLGGTYLNWLLGLAVDNSGDAYVAGYTSSPDFPVTPGAFQTTCDGGQNCRNYGVAFITEINRSGSGLVYSTFLGGSAGDSAIAIALDSAGNAYVTGATQSTDFPVTPGAFQTVCKVSGSVCAGGTAFVTKLNATGSALVYSTYLGGNYGSAGNGIAVDSGGNAYVTGQTVATNFPTLNSLQKYAGNQDAFVTEFGATGSALVFSTYLGGQRYDGGQGIALDSTGNVYVTGVYQFTRLSDGESFAASQWWRL